MGSPRATWVRPYGQLQRECLLKGEFVDAVRLGWSLAREPNRCVAWLRRLDVICARAGNAPAPFDLARKPGKTFVVSTMKPDERIGLLTSHYAHLFAAFGAVQVRRLLCDETLVLATILARSEGLYKLLAQRPHHNSQEGELELVLEAPDGLKIASLDLVVGATGEGGLVHLWIGGLQGCSALDSKTITVAATKDLFGLRPKDLLMHAAYALGEVFAVDSVKAVTNDGHVHARRRAATRWTADYDAFWRELGGAPDGEGMMILPKRRTRRDPKAVPSSKRKAWFARYAIVDAMAEAVKLAAGDGPALWLTRPAAGGRKRPVMRETAAARARPALRRSSAVL